MLINSSTFKINKNNYIETYNLNNSLIKKRNINRPSLMKRRNAVTEDSIKEIVKILLNKKSNK